MLANFNFFSYICNQITYTEAPLLYEAKEH